MNYSKMLPVIFQYLLKCFPEHSALSLHRDYYLCYTTFCSAARPSCSIKTSWIFPLHQPKRKKPKCQQVCADLLHFSPVGDFIQGFGLNRFSAVCFHFWISLFSSIKNMFFLTHKYNYSKFSLPYCNFWFLLNSIQVANILYHQIRF